MSSSSSSDEASSTAAPSEKRRRPSIYESVAGRTTADGNVARAGGHSMAQYHMPLPPDEILFLREERRRAVDLPEDTKKKDPAGTKARRQHFKNIYFAASKRLLEPADGSREPLQLPSSELLKAVHAYASDYYAALAADEPSIDVQSLDETALLAVGVLMEEAVEEMLGESGELALLEEVETDEEMLGESSGMALVEEVEMEEEGAGPAEPDTKFVKRRVHGRPDNHGLVMILEDGLRKRRRI